MAFSSCDIISESTPDSASPYFSRGGGDKQGYIIQTWAVIRINPQPSDTMEANVARPLSKKTRKGLGNTAIHCLDCVLCTVCANQIAEFSYVMLMATFVIKSAHKLLLQGLTML